MRGKDSIVLCIDFTRIKVEMSCYKPKLFFDIPKLQRIPLFTENVKVHRLMDKKKYIVTFKRKA